MTAKTSFTADEWQLLKEVPMLIGTAIMAAGGPTSKEAWTLVQSVAAAADDYPANELIQALLQRDEWDVDEQQQFTAQYEGQSAEEIASDIFARTGQALGILGAKATMQETADYTNWAYSVGVAVAKASKEGGFLGMGGERVSAAEKEALTNIAEALGVEAKGF